MIEIVGQILFPDFRSDDLVGRIGGDEFSAFICSYGGCDAIYARTGKMLSEKKELTRTELKIEVSMSLGIAILQRVRLVTPRCMRALIRRYMR